MNSLNITGRLTADPELRALPSGETVCRLRLALDGLSPRGETGYVKVNCFGKPGDAAARALSKGWLVAVQGRLSYRTWEGADGSKRHDYEVVGNIEFLTAPRGNGGLALSRRERGSCRAGAALGARPQPRARQRRDPSVTHVRRSSTVKPASLSAPTSLATWPCRGRTRAYRSLSTIRTPVFPSSGSRRALTISTLESLCVTR